MGHSLLLSQTFPILFALWQNFFLLFSLWQNFSFCTLTKLFLPWEWKLIYNLDMFGHAHFCPKFKVPKKGGGLVGENLNLLFWMIDHNPPPIPLYSLPPLPLLHSPSPQQFIPNLLTKPCAIDAAVSQAHILLIHIDPALMPLLPDWDTELSWSKFDPSELNHWNQWIDGYESGICFVDPYWPSFETSELNHWNQWFNESITCWLIHIDWLHLV